MFLKRLTINNFRNIQHAKVEFSSELNLISGNNGAGKSSALEALGFVISGRSFRTNKQKLLIHHNTSKFLLFAELSNDDKIGISYSDVEKRKQIKINQQPTKSLSRLTSILPVQTISPESYHLIDSGALERRKHIDWTLFHVEQSYQECWIRFNRLLKQRNSLLRKIKLGSPKNELLIWNSEFVTESAKITQFRRSLVKELYPILRIFLDKVQFQYRDNLLVDYKAGHKEDFITELEQSSDRDIAYGGTQCGPHKGDLTIKIGNNFAKDVLSRGQKKLFINCMFLAQTELLKKLSGKDSVFIIDDLTSELDKNNQSLLIKTLKAQNNVQIFVSCLHPDMINPFIKEYNNTKMFHVEHGVIIEQ